MKSKWGYFYLVDTFDIGKPYKLVRGDLSSKAIRREIQALSEEDILFISGMDSLSEDAFGEVVQAIVNGREVAATASQLEDKTQYVLKPRDEWSLDDLVNNAVSLMRDNEPEEGWLLKHTVKLMRSKR